MSRIGLLDEWGVPFVLESHGHLSLVTMHPSHMILHSYDQVSEKEGREGPLLVFLHISKYLTRRGFSLIKGIRVKLIHK